LALSGIVGIAVATNCLCLEVCQRSIFAAPIEAIAGSQQDLLFSCSMGSSWWIHGETARAKVQKIEELERQNAGLEQDLELLRSSEPLGAEVLAV